MSTRAMIAIARKKKPGIKGIYSHSDGYPTAVAAALFSMYHSPLYGKDHTKVFAELGSHRHGLRFLMPAEVEEGAMFECYCHDRGEAEEREKDAWLRDKDRSSIDYTYVLSEEGLAISYFARGEHTVPWSEVGTDWGELTTRLRSL